MVDCPPEHVILFVLECECVYACACHHYKMQPVSEALGTYGEAVWPKGRGEGDWLCEGGASSGSGVVSGQGWGSGVKYLKSYE
jgi:hypothetical protein